ncbi:MAG: lipoyl synthase, partial [Gammaproteobacteria bacterium]
MNERTDAPVKQRGREKTARIPVKVDSTRVPLRTPAWRRVRGPVGG